MGLICIATSSYANNVIGENPIKLSVVPDHIRVGTTYHGTEVLFEANIPRCNGVVVKLEGRDNEVTLNRKGRVAVLWLNVAQVIVKNAPQAYILAASDKLANICSREMQQRLGLGLESLRKRITFESEKPLIGSEFEEFLRLNEHSGLYNTNIQIELKPAAGDREELSVTLPIPSVMPPGEYVIQLYCFEHGSLMQKTEAQLSIEKVGLPLLISTLAQEHAALYGIAAIIIAMMAGITMGVVFSLRAGRGS